VLINRHHQCDADVNAVLDQLVVALGYRLQTGPFTQIANMFIIDAPNYR